MPKRNSNSGNKFKKWVPIREFGQLALPSSFLIKPKTLTSSQESIAEDVQIKPQKKNSIISLSEFLNRKLDKQPSQNVQSKQKPFSSLVTKKDTVGSTNEGMGFEKQVEAKSVVDEAIFKLFKHPKKEVGACDGSSSGDGSGLGGNVTLITDGKGSRKRRNPFQVSSNGGEERHAPKRYLVALGDDPKPKQKGKDVGYIRKKKPRPLFNHYANGAGWWDCGMEGVDNEEVGCSEVWEGMGSTTLGGLEWH